MSPPMDFEFTASANSATPAWKAGYYNENSKLACFLLARILSVLILKNKTLKNL